MTDLPAVTDDSSAEAPASGEGKEKTSFWPWLMGLLGLGLAMFSGGEMGMMLLGILMFGMALAGGIMGDGKIGEFANGLMDKAKRGTEQAIDRGKEFIEQGQEKLQEITDPKMTAQEREFEQWITKSENATKLDAQDKASLDAILKEMRSGTDQTNITMTQEGVEQFVNGLDSSLQATAKEKLSKFVISQ